MSAKAAMDKAARAGKGPAEVKRAGMRAEDRVFYLILAVIFLFVVVSGLAAAGVL